jgi:hypothetical protein
MDAQVENRLQSLEMRMSMLESKLPTTKGHRHRSLFECPEDIKVIFDKLVAIRKELIKKSGNNGLNLVFSGARLVTIIQSQCCTLDDLRKNVNELGEKNIVEFGQAFLDAIAPPAPVVAPLAPVVAPLAPVVALPTAEDKKKQKIKKATARSQQIYP